MGMEITTLHKHPETRELIVNSDINTGNYNIIANDIMANNITVNNLTSNSITNTGDIDTDTLHASGGITGTLYGEQVHVVECVKSTEGVHRIDMSNDSGVESLVILPFIQSTYYTGEIYLFLYNENPNPGGILHMYNVNNTRTIINCSDKEHGIWHTIQIPDGTIGLIAYASGAAQLNLGFKYNYLPIPPQ